MIFTILLADKKKILEKNLHFMSFIFPDVKWNTSEGLLNERPFDLSPQNCDIWDNDAGHNWWPIVVGEFQDFLIIKFNI